jgi:hypothetical protein
MEESIFVDEGL